MKINLPKIIRSQSPCRWLRGMLPVLMMISCLTVYLMQNERFNSLQLLNKCNKEYGLVLLISSCSVLKNVLP